MAEPAVENGSDSSTESPDSPDGDADDSVDMVETDVESSGVDPEGFFDGVETDASNDPTGEGFFDDADESDEDDSSTSSSGSRGMADDINSGVARAAVIGLDDEWTTSDGTTETKDDLRDEFEETFEAFRLGHYGEEVIQQYIELPEDDIHPVWGLLGASLICGAVIYYRRPDGDELADEVRNKVANTDLGSLKDGLGGSDDTESEPAIDDDDGADSEEDDD